LIGTRQTEIAIVGGGPAGAAVAIALARRGHQASLFERLPRPRWRAAGVYSSPLTRRRLLALGLPEEDVRRLIRPISAMVVQSIDQAASCRLEYLAGEHACGVDRVRLEQRLLDHARAQGVEVHEGSPVIRLDLSQRKPSLTVSGHAGPRSWRASLVVGADGPSSMVARAAGVTLGSRLFRRAALTVHRADPAASPAGTAMDAEMLVGAGWYCGVAPVPGGRVNLGLVLTEAELRRQLRLTNGTESVMGRMLADLPPPVRAWSAAPSTDEIQAALPLLHRVERAAGRNFVLVGDAAGFIDPLSGEGLQRALASAEMASAAIVAWAGGERGALAEYDRRLRARFRSKDVLSWFLQGFLANPWLAGHALRNLGRRDDLRHTFSLALADMLPASRVLDPRYLAQVLAP
jgi:menaquinone-9 beta-reductase